MSEYILGMIYLDPKYCIPEDSKEALRYIKEIRKSALERTIELMKDSPYYFKMSDLELKD